MKQIKTNVWEVADGIAILNYENNSNIKESAIKLCDEIQALNFNGYYIYDIVYIDNANRITFLNKDSMFNHSFQEIKSASKFRILEMCNVSLGVLQDSFEKISDATLPYFGKKKEYKLDFDEYLRAKNLEYNCGDFDYVNYIGELNDTGCYIDIEISSMSDIINEIFEICKNMNILDLNLLTTDIVINKHNNQEELRMFFF